MIAAAVPELGWLDVLLAKARSGKPLRKDLYAIAGFPRWETVISNVLAFYFDPTEEHGFGSLFLDSLLELVEEQAPNLTEPFTNAAGSDGYEVHREWPISEASKRGFLDLLIRSKSATGQLSVNERDTTSADRAIIIENKFGATLYNDLRVYYNAIKADHKFGVVLDLGRNMDLPAHWISLTHQDLIGRVLRNLHRAFTDADDRHLLLLKDFALNLTNQYANMDHVQQAERLRSWQDHKEKIAALYQLRRDLGSYVGAVMDEVMTEFGMITGARNAYTEYRTYLPEPEQFVGFEMEAKGLRAWIPLWEVLDNGQFRMHFELFGKDNTVHGPRIAAALEERIGCAKLGIVPPEAQSPSYNYYHLAVVTGPLLLDKDLASALRMLVAKALAPEHGLIKASLEELRKCTLKP